MKHRAIVVGDRIEVKSVLGNIVTVHIVTVADDEWQGVIQDGGLQTRVTYGAMAADYRLISPRL